MTTATDRAVNTMLPTSTRAEVPSGMLPNGRAAGAPDIKVEAAQLPLDAKQRACEAADRAYDIQIGKGGIEDTTAKLRTLESKVGEQVYSVAKDALKIASGKLILARNYFLALCAVAEQHLYNKHVEATKTEKTIGQLIPQWTNYKSYIGKGLEKGIDPMERAEAGDSLKYATAAQYRKAVTETGAGGTGSQAGTARTKQNGTNGVVLSLVNSGWSPMLATAMGVLTGELKDLTHEEQDKMAPLVSELATKVHAFHEEIMRKITTDVENEEEMEPGERAALAAALAKDEPKVAEAPKGRGKHKAA